MRVRAAPVQPTQPLQLLLLCRLAPLPLAGVTCACGCCPAPAASHYTPILFCKRILMTSGQAALPPGSADLYMAVLLQQVVPAQYAFVLHTADPLTGQAGQSAAAQHD